MARSPLSALALAGLLWSVAPASAVQPPQPPLERAYDALYNLDYDLASNLFEQAIAASPNDPAGYRGAAKNAWLRILFMRGSVTSDEYLGSMSSSDLEMPPPPAGPAADFRRNIDRAVRLAEQAVARQPESASAHYELGAALGFQASYTGTVEGKIFAAMRFARRAFAEHEKVLKLDSRRHDAGLVVGTYRYIVAGLPMPLRWMAYIVGFGGGREAGIRRLQEAAAHPGDARTDARFALVVVYSREGRFDQALATVRDLQRSFPRNRLLWLEEGGTALRAKRPGEAERALGEGITRLRQESRPLIPGESAQLHYKRGVARLTMGDTSAADRDLKEALADSTGPVWVRGRIHTELGKLADLAGDRPRAQIEYRDAIALGEKSRDALAVEEAKLLLKAPYRGTKR